MVVLSYEDWCVSYEDGILDELEAWLDDCPVNRSTIQVDAESVYDIARKAANGEPYSRKDYEALLEEAYVSYVSEYGDYAYDQWKDERMFDECDEGD